jgi:hypothetical protein
MRFRCNAWRRAPVELHGDGKICGPQFTGTGAAFRAIACTGYNRPQI